MPLHLPRPLPPLLSCLSLSSVVTHSYHSYPPLVCCQLHLTRARARILTCAHALGWSLQVRVTNVLNTLMQCFSIVCLITVEWMCFGYSLGLSPSPVCCSLALARSRSLPGLQHSLISPSPVCRSLSLAPSRSLSLALARCLVCSTPSSRLVTCDQDWTASNPRIHGGPRRPQT